MFFRQRKQVTSANPIQINLPELRMRLIEITSNFEKNGSSIVKEARIIENYIVGHDENMGVGNETKGDDTST